MFILYVYTIIKKSISVFHGEENPYAYEKNIFSGPSVDHIDCFHGICQCTDRIYPEGQPGFKIPLVYTQNQTAQKKINQDIATWVYDSKKGYDTGEFYSVETQYEVTYEDDSVISLELINLSYPAGAAHEWVSYDCIVYNKKTGNRIPLYNYVRIRNADQLETGILSMVLPLYNESDEEVEYDSEDWPVNRVSQDYLLRGGGTIDLVYQPYELGPFSDGAISIRFSPEAIKYFNRMNS